MSNNDNDLLGGNMQSTSSDDTVNQSDCGGNTYNIDNTLIVEEIGIPGEKGDKGDPPSHQWSGTQLRFENPDGSWGTYTDLKGQDGTNGLPGAPGLPGEQGVSGEDGKDGSLPEYRYAQNGSTVIPPELVNTDREPEGWSTDVPESAVGLYVWEIVTLIDPDDDSLVRPWSTPIRVTGATGANGQNGADGQDGQTGASAVFRGDWDEDTVYNGTTTLVEIVKYNGQGFISRMDAGDIPEGTLPTDTDYWNPFAGDIDSLAVDILFSYVAYIGNLTVGVVQTAVPPTTIPDPTNQGARTTIGYQPPETTGTYSDPTSDEQVFNRHGIRQYYPSGRVSVYMGQVNGFEYIDQDEITQTVQGWAIIAFKDDEGSPIHFKLDSTTEGGVTYVSGDLTPTWEIWQRCLYIPFSSLPAEGLLYNYLMDSFGDFDSEYLCGVYQEDVGGHVGIKTSPSYWRRIPNASDPDQRIRLVTNSGFNTPVPDGWYVFGTVYQVTGELSHADIDVEIHAYRFVDGYEMFDWEEDITEFYPTMEFTSGNPLDCPVGMTRTTLTYPYP